MSARSRWRCGSETNDLPITSSVSGFGKPTNIDLPGEERGLTKPASRWTKISIGSISMGQEIGVTPLQIIRMVSAVANGGILYQPYVVKKIQDPQNGSSAAKPIRMGSE